MRPAACASQPPRDPFRVSRLSNIVHRLSCSGCCDFCACATSRCGFSSRDRWLLPSLGCSSSVPESRPPSEMSSKYCRRAAEGCCSRPYHPALTADALHSSLPVSAKHALTSPAAVPSRISGC